MKTKTFISAVCCMLLLVASAFANCGNSSCGKANTRYSELPQPVKEFMGKYYAGEKVTSIVADNDDAVTEYDILLSSGTKVEIDANGNWSDVYNPTAIDNLSMLPDTTVSYLKGNYDNAKVTKIENEKNGYEVKLNNGVELKFNADGTFLKIDK